MSRESRKHFLHRIGKWRGNTTSKTSNFHKKFVIASTHLKRCFKNRCWLGKEQSPERTNY